MTNRVSILNVKAGMKLARPIYQKGVCLLDSGKILTQRHIELLKKRKVLRLIIF